MDRKIHTYDFLELLSVEGRRIVDVGCGNGWCSVLLKKLGADVVGVDLLPPNSPVLEDLHQNDIPYFQGIEKLKATGREFDVVWCQNTLEHQFAPIAFLIDLRGLADELWLTVPKENSEGYSKGHIVMYNLPTLVEHLRLAGWDVSEGSFRVTPELSCRDLQAVVRRWMPFEPAKCPWTESDGYSPRPKPMRLLDTRGNNHYHGPLEEYNWLKKRTN